MGLLEWALGALFVGAFIKGNAERAKEEAEEKRERLLEEKREKEAEKRRRKAMEEEQRRMNTPCLFNDGLTKADFERIVKKASKKIRRVSKVTVKGPLIYGIVRSQSGISEWEFSLDFNNYGHITTTYWWTSDNDDSGIPERLGDMISSAIKNYDSGSDEIKEEENQQPTQQQWHYCPNCGERLLDPSARYCVYCGDALQ